jgi:hypothetical protein
MKKSKQQTVETVTRLTVKQLIIMLLDAEDLDNEIIIRDGDNKEVRPATICEKRKERLSALFS